MRIWSVHPKHLDKAGIGAVWREGLLAQKVLRGLTKGYKNHSQLVRFKEQRDPVEAICTYLHYIVDDAERRGYNYNRDLIVRPRTDLIMKVTTGQFYFEIEHLRKKLEVRSPVDFETLEELHSLSVHPMFRLIEGEVSSWEKA